VTCYILLESSRQGIQFFFKPHFIRRSAQKVMGLQSCRSPNLKNFAIPNLGILGQNDIWVQTSWLGIENIIKGKVVASPKSGSWWVLWVHVYMWLIRAPKMFQLCTNKLVVWFVQVLMNNWPNCHSSQSPSRSSSTPLYPRSVTSQGTCPNSLSFYCFHLGLTFESIRELGCASKLLFYCEELIKKQQPWRK
jgi:hypothetical protein